jgi:anti-anti-sigma factor
MPTEITEKSLEGITMLSVRGEMNADDAEILRRLVRDMLAGGRSQIIVDLADLAFIDSDSAPILREIANLSGVSIEGTDSLIQTAIDLVEKRSR